MNAKNRSAAALLLCLPLFALGACGVGREDAQRAAGNATAATQTVTEQPPRTVTKTVSPEPAPTVTRTHVDRDPTPAPADPGQSFVAAYESAGITAPPGWADETAVQVCDAWQSGRSTDDTDAILLDGGIYANHVRVFSDIIEAWYCPGDQP
ncbi:DUF732 domain-containing protein [Actinomadura macrotermitis]|uniref:DUF732 domain-containing protein n=1 Tax=Actinomadura macrotermitis TaxID=2585200 RepID=A0A7K0C3K3_9ACTN|nr:DUF732 domain-containing protein [Actinomadura macrotermitis]MQY08021.1 hypothetical protein [Actinomadura macrotermitis]